MPPRLGDILVKDGACSEDAVRDALKNQIIFGGRLGTNLLEIHGVAEDALTRALGRQHALPALGGDLRPARQATSLITSDIADRWDAIPYALADRRLALLVVDPRNLAMLDEVAFATGKQVHPIVVPEARIWALLRRTYGVERNLRGIDVDFAKLSRAGARELSSEAASGAAARTEAADLIDEREFDALYGGTPADRPEPPSASTSTGRHVVVSRAPAGAAPPARPAAPAPSNEPDDVIELTDLLEPEAPDERPSPTPAPIAAEALAALVQRPGHAPPVRLAVPAAPRAREPEPSPLSFAEAVRFLEGVDERSSIAKTVLRYARSKFRRAVLLTVQRGGAHGWAGLGERVGAESVRRMHLALGTPGILDMVVRTQAHFLGPIPKTEANIRLLKALGGGVPGNAFVVPILAMGRVVNLFYADNGKGGVVNSGDVGELLILATRIANSYDTLLARVR